MFRNKRNTNEVDTQTKEAIDKHMPTIAAGLAAFLEVPTRKRLDDLIERITDLEIDANGWKQEPVTDPLSEVADALESLRIRIGYGISSRHHLTSESLRYIYEDLQGIENAIRELEPAGTSYVFLVDKPAN